MVFQPTQPTLLTQSSYLIAPQELWVQLTPSQQHRIQRTLIAVCQGWLRAQLPAQEEYPHER